MAWDLLVEARRRALGQAVSERFHRPAHVVDHLGAATDQRLARMDYRQVSLGVAASVLHRVQKFRIGPSEAGQLLGIELVGLTPFAIDQPSLTRISDQYLVATLGKQTAYPGRVGSDFDGDMQRPFRIEPASHRLWGGAQPAPFDELAAFGVDETEVAVVVSQIHTRRHLHLLGATITHGPILLSLGHKRARRLFADPPTGYCAEDRPSHLI